MKEESKKKWQVQIVTKSVYITRYHSMKVPVSFRTLHATANKTILVDSGATDNFIHPKLLWRLGLGSQPLERPQKIWNIDGTTNKAGALTHCVDLEVRTGDKQEVMKFLVTDLGVMIQRIVAWLGLSRSGIEFLA